MTEADRKTMERSIIGCVLLDSSRCLPVAVNAGTDVDWFTDDFRKLVWYTIRLLWTETKGTVDMLTVSERAKRVKAGKDSPFKNVTFDIVEFQKFYDETPTTAHFEYYLQLARSEVMLRRVVKAQDQMKRELADGADVEHAAENLQRRIVAAMSMSMASRTVSLEDMLRKIEGEYQAAHVKRIDEQYLEYTPGFPLPWKPFNTASQGVQEGLIYVGARPSVGKTAFILNLVRFWCERGIKVAFNSLDMAVKPLLKRPVGEMSRVSFAKASFGTTDKSDLEKMNAAIWGKDGAGGIVRWPLKIVQERNVDTFRSWCVAMKQTGQLDIVVVDFVQLMGTRARYSNDNEKIEYVSGVLKSIAIDLEIPVIALSQLNRACEDDGGRVPTSSDLRGSGALEQDATAVWILHNERDVQKAWYAPNGTPPVGLTYNGRIDEFKGISPVRVILAKNQNGQAGPDVWFPFVFFKKYCLFMLADVEAQPTMCQVGYGATAKQVPDYSPRFGRVTHDWRGGDFERRLASHGCLIGGQCVQSTL